MPDVEYTLEDQLGAHRGAGPGGLRMYGLHGPLPAGPELAPAASERSRLAAIGVSWRWMDVDGQRLKSIGNGAMSTDIGSLPARKGPIPSDGRSPSSGNGMLSTDIDRMPVDIGTMSPCNGARSTDSDPVSPDTGSLSIDHEPRSACSEPVSTDREAMSACSEPMSAYRGATSLDIGAMSLDRGATSACITTMSTGSESMSAYIAALSTRREALPSAPDPCKPTRIHCPPDLKESAEP